MRIDRIEIENFRSIKSEVVKFDHNCLILLGKNEAGKSNVLKAIAAVFGKYKVTIKDKRKKINNEKINDSYIHAVIKNSQEDIAEILEIIQNKYSNTELIEFDNELDLKQYINKYFNEFLIRILINDQAKAIVSYWKHKNPSKIREIYLSSNMFDTLDNSGIFQDNESINLIIFDAIKTLYNNNPFKCNYWKYDSTLLLPNKIVIKDFITDPDSCEGLYNIFKMCNRSVIKKEFDEALAQDGDYYNLLDQISKEVTRIFQKKWNDFKETKIELLPDGQEISIKVTNKTKYSFEDRSDGFKKFISVLLMLSTKSIADEIGEKDIILIDEPDQSLYPTSARYLRDELLRISEKSIVIYSTHSQYMIDSNCIDRHLIVEKKNDTTTLQRQDVNSPFCNDELLRNAIGVSIFECIKEKNIIFEGWLDKELFEKFCSDKKTKDYANYGIVYLHGISGVETIVQLLILAKKKFVIVADSDKASKDKRKDFEEKYPEYKYNWIGYDDSVKNISTMEDFFASQYIEKIIKENGYNDYEYNDKKNAIENIEKAVNNNKDEKQKIKCKLIESYGKDKIITGYDTFINVLKEKIQNL